MIVSPCNTYLFKAGAVRPLNKEPEPAVEQNVRVFIVYARGRHKISNIFNSTTDRFGTKLKTIFKQTRKIVKKI